MTLHFLYSYIRFRQSPTYKHQTYSDNTRYKYNTSSLLSLLNPEVSSASFVITAEMKYVHNIYFTNKTFKCRTYHINIYINERLIFKYVFMCRPT